MPIRPDLRKLYPENWSEITNRIRFERAGGSCERCGVQHGQPHPETGKVLFKIEHEVRSMYHPMFGRERNFVNRNPVQNLQAYSRGRDALVA